VTIFNKTVFALFALFATLVLDISAVAVAAEPLPSISITNVHHMDVVLAAQGQQKPGSLEFALRDGDTVRYFANNESCELYVANPSLYPDQGPGIRLAFMGADPVARFPKGVRDPTPGVVAAGSLGFLTTHKGFSYVFTSMANLGHFSQDPEKYIPAVGGYCLGAMSQKRITPGDPRNAFFVPEDGKTGRWAVFGSENGPKVWAKKTSQERREALAAAYAYYNQRAGQTPHSDQVASR